MRSKLFVPGSRPELFAKAFHGPADAISLDLEDSVSADRKAEARAEVRAWLDRLAADPMLKNGKTVIVRVNPPDTPCFDDDMRAVCHPAVDTINLPKPAGPDSVRQAAALIGALEPGRGGGKPLGLLLNIETPAALRRAAELAGADPRVEGLQLGLADLFEGLGICRTERSAIEQAMYAVRMAAGEAGVYAYDAAYADIRDAEGYRAEALLARRLGFLGKSCIHPSQVATANAVFQPSADEIAFAQRILAAAETAKAQGLGAYRVDGRMVDPPFELRARNVVAAASRYGLI
ncbi:HpcH/HpaI aldolase/citrate lyase family protein [Parapusillimonas granuli]|uniref:CoA ester lyase n=1 Tax=Parapusillimonas granuli TaxID=380911 RepID=A0A853G0Z7_9BURK|nr:CoA ester lyase [Parapusillimonas granuli]MBB5217270.1 citrate lyase subunit beta/citryl-CoA lyase [Parapusillimonas granuli]MEB2399283.1 CoA ester lyase [Alcaligenaceae bacterium]NYT50938.1 CoA ester lyase [Parapusillimonas granuli]